MQGRRRGSVDELELPGDYAGPFDGYSVPDKTAVFFLLPIAGDPDVPKGARSIHHVTSPPHVFLECDDGSLEIRESIGARPDKEGDPYLWHGYLDSGHQWREC